MTVIVVLADPPRPGLVLSDLPATTPLSAAAAADLYAASLKDTFRAAEQSGGDLLVNFRPEDLLPDAHLTDTAPEAELRALAAEALEDPSAARYEPQVGSTVSARAGNTVTHLLREEAVGSAAVLRGTAPLCSRATLDAAAMKLRTNEVVLGPALDGRTYFAGFTAPVDFADAFRQGELETLTDRGRDADADIEFLPLLARVGSGQGLRTLLPQLRSRISAERVVPKHTATFVHEHGLRVRGGEIVADAADT